MVEHVILADADPLLAAFWHVAAFDTSWLIQAMKDEEVTVARWDWWRLASPARRRDRALKCLFLNRTTFSGILHGRAGPIGGRAQVSAYKIDCRYGVAGLERRIRAVGDLADTGRLLDVWNCDWREILRRAAGFGGLSGRSGCHFDPPYVEKSPELYEWSLTVASMRPCHRTARIRRLPVAAVIRRQPCDPLVLRRPPGIRAPHSRYTYTAADRERARPNGSAGIKLSGCSHGPPAPSNVDSKRAQLGGERPMTLAGHVGLGTRIAAGSSP